VESAAPDHADLIVTGEGAISNRKGVNTPSVVLPISPLTAKDRRDLNFALDLGADWIALSFVQRAEDMAELRRLVQGRGRRAGQDREALRARPSRRDPRPLPGRDGGPRRPGRGAGARDVPVAQKTIVRAARQRGIPCIVATQMLESMITSPSPTRAEVSDVANAVYEGADALMLSGESAAGAFPVEAVETMDSIIARVEQDPRWPGLMDAEHAEPEHGSRDAVPAAARVAAGAANAACLVAYTSQGSTAQRMSRERPLQPVLALTPYLSAARKLALVWGVEPRIVGVPADLDDMTNRAVRAVLDNGLAGPGRAVLIVAGVPFGTPGATNLFRLAYTPRR
jgi:pyruvate kinase